MGLSTEESTKNDRFADYRHHRRTGNGSSGRIMLRTMLAETPLVKNLQNPEYVRLLFEGKSSLEEVFAEIEIATVREDFRKAQLNPEQIPTEIQRLIASPDYPAKLVRMVAKAAAGANPTTFCAKSKFEH